MWNNQFCWSTFFIRQLHISCIVNKLKCSIHIDVHVKQVISFVDIDDRQKNLENCKTTLFEKRRFLKRARYSPCVWTDKSHIILILKVTQSFISSNVAETIIQNFLMHTFVSDILKYDVKLSKFYYKYVVFTIKLI